MKSYEFLEHTADIKFRAYGKTFAHALSNAALAVTEIVTDVKKIKEKKQFTIIFSSEDREAMVFDFISHIIALMDGENFLTSRAEIEIDNQKLTAHLYGDYMKNYEIHGDVKAMTYSDLIVEENKGKCMIQVVVDI